MPKQYSGLSDLRMILLYFLEGNYPILKQNHLNRNEKSLPSCLIMFQICPKWDICKLVILKWDQKRYTPPHFSLLKQKHLLDRITCCRGIRKIFTSLGKSLGKSSQWRNFPSTLFESLGILRLRWRTVPAQGIPDTHRTEPAMPWCRRLSRRAELGEPKKSENWYT